MTRKIKRSISLLTMATILASSSAVFSADATGGTRVVEYYKYDLQLEGDEVRFNPYSLTISEANFNTRDSLQGVTFPDDRIPDTNSSVVRLKIHYTDQNSSGFVSVSGFIVDAHTIATAAHVLFEPNAAGVEYGVEYGYALVYDEDLGREVQHTITEMHIPKAYTTNQIHDYDYALVTVDADLSEYGVFELGCVSGEADITDSIWLSVSGFPAKLLDANGNIVTNSSHQMYTGRGKLLANQDERIFYSNDASGGNSGGPVYVTTRYTTDGTNWTEFNTVVGICTGHDYLGSVDCNDAKKITEPLLQFYLNNPYIGY